MMNRDKPNSREMQSKPLSRSLNQTISGFHQQSWSQAIAKLEQAGTDYVIATIVGTTGSTPRAASSKMVITAYDIFDTLGGGHLEYKVIEHARKLLLQGETTQDLSHFQLGANLGQCCGGAAVVMFETMVCQKLRLNVYGAGHVAQALIPILGQLPVRINWIDNRADIFPEHMPENVIKVVDEEPVEQAKIAVDNMAHLILTHNHQLDFALAEAIIKAGNASWLGVIGSETKAKRFKHRLAHRDFNQEQIAQMTCPVGLSNVSGKLPMEVAVSIAGEIINLYQSAHTGFNQADSGHEGNTSTKKREGLQWQSLQQSLKLTPDSPAMRPRSATQTIELRSVKEEHQ
ncbi:MAG: xanthine dehydrogenase accessory protein XdhC [Thalassotalea sp.]|nr:xanthine dehydrogenase accessory protein XdhC [Thalassotalea sp.]